MRIWDLDPGYLNRQSLLGEHRELHGIVSIFVNGKKGYLNHPETQRWIGYGWALQQRHRLLSAEMSLRGYEDKTPVTLEKNKGRWPETYIDHPGTQFQLLKKKYIGKEFGRIPLPSNPQELWSQHKYSILARNEALYRSLGREVSKTNHQNDLSNLAQLLTEQLKIKPSDGGMHNALQHMWGYVSRFKPNGYCNNESLDLCQLLDMIQDLSKKHLVGYLLSSTALAEFRAWMPRVAAISDRPH
ncbi:MAG: DUF1722 domain-containing protein [Magnetococcales bacterium]|nr:DUF1722 domain-containing protein [Magnetococcales bacterium]